MTIQRDGSDAHTRRYCVGSRSQEDQASRYVLWNISTYSVGRYSVALVMGSERQSAEHKSIDMSIAT